MASGFFDPSSPPSPMALPADWAPAPHGTYARYQYHWKLKEEACDPCKAANAAKARRYRAENAERVREHDRKSKAKWRTPSVRKAANLLKTHGLPLDRWVAMLEAQGDRCAICRDDFTPARGPQVDHCHASGQIRSLLCFQCNVGLGNYYDSPSLLRAAADYLERHERNRRASGQGDDRASVDAAG